MSSQDRGWIPLTDLLRQRQSDRLRLARKLPVRPNEMASVTIWITLQIVLMLRLGFPEGTGWSYFGDHFTGP